MPRPSVPLRSALSGCRSLVGGRSLAAAGLVVLLAGSGCEPELTYDDSRPLEEYQDHTSQGAPGSGGPGGPPAMPTDRGGYDQSEFFQSGSQDAPAAESDGDSEPEPKSDPMTEANSGQPLPLEVSVGQTKALLDQNPETVLIDCREPDEYETVKIDRATLVPMSDFEDKLKKLGDLEGKPVIVHCHHGGRSLRAAKWLREHGVPQAQSMAGGIDDWATEIEPGMKRY